MAAAGIFQGQGSHRASFRIVEMIPGFGQPDRVVDCQEACWWSPQYGAGCISSCWKPQVPAVFFHPDRHDRPRPTRNWAWHGPRQEDECFLRVQQWVFQVPCGVSEPGRLCEAGLDEALRISEGALRSSFLWKWYEVIRNPMSQSNSLTDHVVRSCLWDSHQVPSKLLPALLASWEIAPRWNRVLRVAFFRAS